MQYKKNIFFPFQNSTYTLIIALSTITPIIALFFIQNQEANNFLFTTYKAITCLFNPIAAHLYFFVASIIYSLLKINKAHYEGNKNLSKIMLKHLMYAVLMYHIILLCFFVILLLSYCIGLGIIINLL